MALKPLKTLNFGGEDTYYLDFKNVENTPFETVGGDTVICTGTEPISLNGVVFKVSDAVPTLSDLSNGGIFIINGESFEFSAEDPEEFSGIVTLGSAAAFVPAEQAGVYIEELDITFPETGTYLSRNPSIVDMIVDSLTINGYTGFTTTTLKTDYVPVDYITEKVLSALPTWSGGSY